MPHDRSWPVAGLATIHRGLLFLRGGLEIVREGYSVSSARRRSLYPELLHSATQCAGMYSQEHSRSVRTFDTPFCQYKGLQNLSSFEIFEASWWRRNEGGVLRTQDMFVDPQHRFMRRVQDYVVRTSQNDETTRR